MASPTSGRPRSGSTTSEDSEDVILVRLDNKILMDPLSPSSEAAPLREPSNLDACPEESPSVSPDCPGNPRTEGEATAAEATMASDLETEETGRMTDELEAEFEAFLRAQGGAAGASESVRIF